MKKIGLKDKRILIIRNGNIEDAENMVDYICQIGKESDFLTFGEGEMNITVEKEKDIIDEFMKSDNSLFLVAVIEDKIVGSLNFKGGLRPRIKHTGEFGVSVLKEYWGLGIGTELILHLIDWARESNIIKKINLRSREDNERGIELYRKLGFKKEGVISRDFCVNGDYYSSVFMGLELE